MKDTPLWCHFMDEKVETEEMPDFGTISDP